MNAIARSVTAAWIRPTLAAVAMASTAAAADPVEAPLPPELPWQGRSESLIVDAAHRWVTPAEQTGLAETPRYDQTMAWLRELVEASPRLHWTTIGASAQGRAIRMIIADADGAASPGELDRARKPVLLAHAGIHSGEIDGKDAGLMLLRDMTVRGKRDELLEACTLLFIPILSPDGHERFSAYSRINQRGPAEMGWRTNARNLNLNRDFAKLETRELQAVVEVIEAWQPDLYVDLHVTNGADYQYDITYGWNGEHAWSPAIAGWLNESFRPAVDAGLREWGHLPGPLVFTMNGRDMSAGMPEWTASPRYSNGWGDARHLPTILVENHSLKPYRQRVLGTYVFLAAAMQVLGERFEALREAVASDRNPAPQRVTLAWQPEPEDQRQEVEFAGVRSELHLSAVSGAPTVRWTGQPETMRIPLVEFTRPQVTVKRPPAYFIPAQWSGIAAKLSEQGVAVDSLEHARTVAVERYRLSEAELDAGNTPFEGRARYTAGEPETETVEVELPPGSFRVDTDQPLGTLAVLLLEPQSPDSYFQWGYLDEILQRTEYFDDYVMEPLARRMLENDPELAERFEQKLLNDAEFAADAQARLNWFYRQTPYYDALYRVYPIYRATEQAVD